MTTNVQILDRVGRLLWQLLWGSEADQAVAYSDLRQLGIIVNDTKLSIELIGVYQQAIRDMLDASPEGLSGLSVEGAMGGLKEPLADRRHDRAPSGHESFDRRIYRIVDSFLKFDKHETTLNRLGQGRPVSDADQNTKPRPESSDPSGYEEIKKNAVLETHQFRQTLANSLAPALNARIRAMPQETLEQKKALADWVNDELEPLGLAVRDPKTGKPAQIRGDVGDYLGVGRYQFRFQENKKTVRSTTTNELPVLIVVDAFPPPEVGTHFQDMVGPKSNRTGRKLGD